MLRVNQSRAANGDLAVSLFTSSGPVENLDSEWFRTSDQSSPLVRLSEFACDLYSSKWNALTAAEFHGK